MISTAQPDQLPIVVVGGGLAGLTAALLLARGGRSVHLYERASNLGGRARTLVRQGYHLELGPHALYRGLAAERILRSLGVSWQGKSPQQNGLGLRQGRLQPLPTSPSTILTSELLRHGARREYLGAFIKFLRVDPQPLRSVALADWLQVNFRQPVVRELLAMLVRTATYSADIDRLSAGAALAQARSALLKNVTYIDGGWLRLVEQLQQLAEQAGVTFQAAQRVTAVVCAPGSQTVRGVQLADGTVQEAAAIILAVGPAQAADLLRDCPAHPLAEWAEQAVPVQAACLVLGLRSLPQPKTNLVLGLDQPLYLSVHSAAAQLAPAGGAVLHLAKYLTDPAMTTPAADRAELEQLLDLAQPGWRQQVVEQQYLPRLTVSNALVCAATGGLAGRPDPAVPGIPGLYVAGDWVGSVGMLSDAALASAEAAAQQLLALVPGQRVAVGVCEG